MTICLAPRGAWGGGDFRSRFTCRVFGRASISASPFLVRRMTKMALAGYPALQYLQSGRVRRIQGQFFDFFWGMLAVSLDNATSDHMDTIRWPDPLSTNACLSSGIARLSGPIWDRANRVTQVCHLERIVPKARSPNWPYGRLDRAPLSVPLETTLGAPRRGAKTTCERWQDRSVASDVRNPVADNPPYSINSII